MHPRKTPASQQIGLLALIILTVSTDMAIRRYWISEHGIMDEPCGSAHSTCCKYHYYDYRGIPYYYFRTQNQRDTIDLIFYYDTPH